MKRYYPAAETLLGMAEHPEGDYVLYSEHESTRTACAAYREILEEVAEVLADMNWHTDRGLRKRVIEVLCLTLARDAAVKRPCGCAGGNQFCKECA